MVFEIQALHHKAGSNFDWKTRTKSFYERIKRNYWENFPFPIQIRVESKKFSWMESEKPTQQKMGSKTYTPEELEIQKEFRKMHSIFQESEKNEISKESRLKVNDTKNRYYDVLPYEHNRVILGSKELSEGSDYINANHVSHENQQVRFQSSGITRSYPEIACDWRFIAVDATLCDDDEPVLK